MKKLKVLTISDYPLGASGVSHTMKEIVKSLLIDENIEICSMGILNKKMDLQPSKPDPRWSVFPIEGFRDISAYRQFVDGFKPDLIIFQSDPRFYKEFLLSDNEWRKNVPLIWYTIWDNYPYPIYNDKIWDSVDYTVCISQVTYDIVNKVSPNVKNYYMPHAVNPQVFKTYDKNMVNQFIDKNLPYQKDKFTVFWNNKNARRKNGATLIDVFGKFANNVGRDKVFMLMHTNVDDPNGFDLLRIVQDFGLQDCIGFSQEKVPDYVIAMLNNCADVTINISDNEGFGLNVIESLSCGTPVIANLTGGMIEQMILEDGTSPGIGIKPSCTYIIGEPANNNPMAAPYIYENRVSNVDIENALVKMFNMPKEDRQALGRLGQEHINKNFSYEKFGQFWPNFVREVNNKCESWPRIDYLPYTFTEI